MIDAHLGAHLIKQRIARTGEGRSGGFRSIIVYVVEERAVLLHVFAKNERANLTGTEESAYRDIAKLLAGLPDEACARAVEANKWTGIR